jgi:hypothetical protein
MTKPKTLANTPKIMVFVIWGIDELALVEIAAPNLRVSTKYSCEFAIPHMEANVKTHRPNQGLKGLALHWNNAQAAQPK